MIRVALLAIQNCMYSSLTGPFDFFSVAAYEWQRMAAGEKPLFKPVVVGPKNRTITAFNGTPVVIHDIFSPTVYYDIVFVPVIFGDVELLLDDSETVGWLADQGEHGACLCSACAGAFFLAETGCLNGRKATTHWNLADRFAARFPEVILKREKMLVDEGDTITAGGVFAYLDLSLYLAGRFGSPELAAVLSKFMLIDPARRLQSPYQTKSWVMNHGDMEILAVQQWLAANFSQPATISDMAARARLGERTLIRRFKKATGDPPLKYLQQIRIEEARKLLETTLVGIEEITRRIGYEDISSFRKLFKRNTGLSPSAYRKRFSVI